MKDKKIRDEGLPFSLHDQRNIKRARPESSLFLARLEIVLEVWEFAGFRRKGGGDRVRALYCFFTGDPLNHRAGLSPLITQVCKGEADINLEMRQEAEKLKPEIRKGIVEFLRELANRLEKVGLEGGKA